MAKNCWLMWCAPVLALMTACGGDTSPLDEPEDTPSGDDTADDDMPEPTPEAPTETACTGLEVPMTPVEELPEGAYVCEYSCVPNEKITDFSIWNAGGTTIWGDDMSLTGGTFEYKNDGFEGAESLTVEVDTATGTAHITGNIVGGYAGWGLWFGECTDASRFTGVRFVMGGDIGNAELQLQVQQNNNYPIDTSAKKGACGGDWNDGCASHSFTYELAFPAEPAEFKTAFTELAGGAPNELESAELLGVQWQFNCEESQVCAVDVILDEVSFY